MTTVISCTSLPFLSKAEGSERQIAERTVCWAHYKGFQQKAHTNDGVQQTVQPHKFKRHWLAWLTSAPLRIREIEIAQGLEPRAVGHSANLGGVCQPATTAA